MNKIVVTLGVILLVLINFSLYRAEFSALVDPNDNIFQYALIDEARNIWKEIFAGKLSPMYLLDSWNERWAEGFALTSYYAHLPQAVLGLFGGYKLFVTVRTLMLIGLPLMFFLGGTILRLPSAYNLILALLSQAIFTDGLYGIDATSYMWRGWGLSAQLMAVFFLPVAFGYAIDYLENKKNLGKAIFFNFLVASSHFGIFSLVLMGYGLYWPLNFESWDQFKYQIANLKSRIQRSKLKEVILPSLILIGSVLFSVSYFIVPFFSQNDYRNFSVWDPIWKFDSWGLKQIFIWFFNGDLFDFNRLPIITFSVLAGLFVALAGKNKIMKYFAILFIFYFILFLGRATLGGVIDLIPGFSEYHQHRVIVLVQFIGIFIAGNLLYKLGRDLHGFLANFRGFHNQRESVKNQWESVLKVLFIIILIATIIYLERPLLSYARDNAVWLDRANQAYLRDLPDYEKIKNRLSSLPSARVYVGKPGNWGKQFTVGETPLYMVLSRDGYPTIGFLPESWSMNSDPEQFFNENDLNFYNLYNVGYSILPENVNPPEFAELVVKEGKYNLYRIRTEGWFASGTSSIAVKSDKNSLLNPTRLWFESDLFKQGDYPIIDYDRASPDGKRWYIEMTDKNNWINLNDGRERNLWAANPFSANIGTFSQSAKNSIFLTGQEKLVNGYKARVEVTDECKNCIVMLKQSFHPGWQVRLNGELAESFPVLPFYIGIPVEKSGEHDLVVQYIPSLQKKVLFFAELVVLASFLLLYFKKRLRVK